MNINRKEIKALSREQIKGNIGMFLLVSIVLGLLWSALGPLILGGPITLGFAYFILDIVRGRKGEFETAFAGFRQFGSSWVAFIVSGLVIGLGMMLLVIPGIIASLAYSMAFFILADNPGMGGIEALKQSRQLMKGHKWQYFVLNLSFIGWHLLAWLTLGLAYIYVLPYQSAAQANFYAKLKSESLDIDGEEPSVAAIE